MNPYTLTVKATGNARRHLRDNLTAATKKGITSAEHHGPNTSVFRITAPDAATYNQLLNWLRRAA